MHVSISRILFIIQGKNNWYLTTTHYANFDVISGQDKKFKLKYLINKALKRKSIKELVFLISLQSISGDVADNVSHPRRLDPTIELITYSFVLYLPHGRHNVKMRTINYGFKGSFTLCNKNFRVIDTLKRTFCMLELNTKKEGFMAYTAPRTRSVRGLYTP